MSEGDTAVGGGQLARKTQDVLTFVGAERHEERDNLRMDLSRQSQWLDAQL